MYKFDERFLDMVGLGAMPQEQRAAFLEYAQDQLEIRVGEKMSAAMNEAQIDEFEKIADDDPETIQRLLAGYGDYQNDEVYQKIAQNVEDEAGRKSNYVTAKWLDANCPNYTQIIENTLEELKNEISSNKDAILAQA